MAAIRSARCPDRRGVPFASFSILHFPFSVSAMELSKFFVKGELIPVICQDERSGEVLMLGYANEEALRLTMETGTAWFYSRSRRKLWNKGETSGNFIYVSRILSDCDDDTLIYSGIPKGPVCHTGSRTCFYTTLWERG